MGGPNRPLPSPRLHSTLPARPPPFPPLPRPHYYNSLHAVFKIDVFNALQNILYLSQNQPTFQMQPQMENEDVTWSLQYTLLAKRINKRRALSLQEVELKGWFLFLHIVLKTCTIEVMRMFNMSFIFHFYVLGLTSCIWTSPSTEALKFETPSKWNSYEGFNLEHCLQATPWTGLAGPLRESNSTHPASAFAVALPSVM